MYWVSLRSKSMNETLFVMRLSRVPCFKMYIFIFSSKSKLYSSCISQFCLSYTHGFSLLTAITLLSRSPEVHLQVYKLEKDRTSNCSKFDDYTLSFYLQES